MAAERALRVVDETTGELHDSCPGCVKLEQQLEVLQGRLAGMAGEIGKLRADHRAEAEADPLWPLCLRVFAYHNAVFNHPGAEWSVKRFDMVSKRLKAPDGLERCLKAIAGRRTDAWMVERKKTTFDHVFEKAKDFEACVALCPSSWQPPRGSEELVGRG